MQAGTGQDFGDFHLDHARTKSLEPLHDVANEVWEAIELHLCGEVRGRHERDCPDIIVEVSKELERAFNISAKEAGDICLKATFGV